MDRRTALACLITIVLSGLGASSAQAGLIVWQRGAEIWVMKDDGSNRSKLVGAADASGMDSIGNPNIASAGKTVVFEGVKGSAQTYATGIYRLSGGISVSRVSPDPLSICPRGASCPTRDLEPEVMGDSGRAIFAYRSGSGFSTSGDILSTSLSGDDRQGFLPKCRGTLAFPSDPTSNPANPAEVAYVGCRDANNVPELVVSQANRAGERVIRKDDGPITDPSFAGSGVLAVEGGDEPGIWLTPAAGGAARRVVATNSSPLPSGPRQIIVDAGFFKISYVLFSMNGDLWRVPLSCNPCTFPASATQLTTDGSAPVDSSVAWTSQTSLAFTFFPRPTAGTGGGGTGGGEAGTGGFTEDGSFTGDSSDFPAFDDAPFFEDNFFGSEGEMLADEGAGGARDGDDPNLRRLRLAPRNFRPYPLTGRAPNRGTVLSFTLDEKAAIRFSYQRATVGRRQRGIGEIARARRSGRCFKATTGNRRSGRCTLWKPLKGSFSFAPRKKKTRFRLTGWLGGAPLRPGSYRLAASAKDGAGNRSKVVYAPFKVLR